MRSKHQTNTMRLLWIGFFLSLIISIAIGRYAIDPLTQIKILLNQLGIGRFDLPREAVLVMVNIRLPRLLGGMLVGLALSASGCAFQSLFQNPMVSPSILGASAGAGFGAAIGILIGLSGLMISLSAFVFGLIAVLLCMLISRQFRFDVTLGLILTGMIVSSVFTSGISFIKLIADQLNTLPAITYWLMGTFSGMNYPSVVLAAGPILISFLGLYLLRWRINLLAMGAEEAQTMGVSVKRLRLVVMVFATVMTAASVSISGMIGWVGLIIPHFARMLVGSDLRVTLPASALLGSTFLILVDTISRSVHTSEIPIGILTSLVGAPIFLLLLQKARRQ